MSFFPLALRRVVANGARVVVSSAISGTTARYRKSFEYDRHHNNPSPSLREFGKICASQGMTRFPFGADYIDAIKNSGFPLSITQYLNHDALDQWPTLAVQTRAMLHPVR